MPLRKLLIFDTHPIQYRSPVFRELARELPDFFVYFFNESFDAKKWWYGEVDKTPKQVWNLPLLEGFKSSVLNLRSLGLLKRYQKLHGILSSERPTAVLIYGYYEWEHWCLRMLCQKMEIPLLFVGETFSGKRSFLRTRLLRFFFRGVHRFLSVGKKTGDYYLEQGILADRIVSAKYCVDVSFFEASETESQKLRKEWRVEKKVPQEGFIVLFVGRLFARKRPLDLVAIHHEIASLRSQRQGDCSQRRVFTVVIGNGELEEDLRIESASLERFQMLGFQDQKELRRAYYGSDLLLIPSEFETWGLVANEAAACGRPSIVTDTCGVAGDLVCEGETGFIVKVGEIDAFAKRISQMAADPALTRKLGEASRRKVNESYTPRHFARSVLEALRHTQ